MTAAVLTQLPLSAGSALASSLTRAARWGMGQYARAPLSNTAIVALAGFSLLASSNALYFQSHEHPSPLFAPPTTALTQPAPVPVSPVVRSKPKTATVQTTGTVTPKALPPITKPIGNADVLAIQQKLHAIGLFDGKLDGLYGPRTARAIKKFEERQGLPAKGELTQQVLQAILSAPESAPTPIVHTATQKTGGQPVSAVTAVPTAPVVENALPAVSTVAELSGAEPVRAVAFVATEPEAQPLQAEPQPLPMPQPLEPTIQVASAGGPLSPPAEGQGESIASILAPNTGAAEPAQGVLSTVAPAAPAAELVAAVQPMPPLPSPAHPGTTPGPVTDVALQPTSTRPGPVSAPAAEAETVADIVTSEMPSVATQPAAGAVESKDPRLVAKVQRGLASLGFLSGEIDGVPGEATAKAIRNFEVWNNYDVTGRVTPGLVQLLAAAGAEI